MQEKEIEIVLSPVECSTDEQLYLSIEKKLNLPSNTFCILKKSLDARSKNIHYNVKIAIDVNKKIDGFQFQNVINKPEIHIVGFGPAGIFAALQCIELGYKPIVFEMGKNIKDRRRDLAILNKNGVVNPTSNYCFGEGGAGTYSDGKLYTRSNKRGNLFKVLEAFVLAGANQNILYEAHPHIGTNKLPQIIEQLRNQILACGGEIYFNAELTDLIIEQNRIKKIEINGAEKYLINQLILATGHSARDIFYLLHNKKIAIEAKPFAIGVRVEHPQEIINEMQYKCNPEIRKILPPASYNLVEQVGKTGVFSFCMCPGGIIAPAATGLQEVVVNGWSPSKRNGNFANSGFVVSIDDKDFAIVKNNTELRGLEYQKLWEKKAFEVSNSIKAPSQRMLDFLNQKVSNNLPNCSYIPGIISANIGEVLDNNVTTKIAQAIHQIGVKKPPYKTNEAILVGVESRTSSPVKIPRNKDNLQHIQISNLYPCAEGAGYAGGIISAAMDGMNCVLEIAKLK